MSKYLKKFETQAAYEAAKPSLILPNVSLIIENNGVEYNPYTDPCQQHDYVEIGGVKWATKNVGACDVTDYGLLFQWGDAQGYSASQVGSGEGQKYFGWADYKYGNGTSNPGNAGMSKYNSTDKKSTFESTDDAATVAWGGGWRTPTLSEIDALKENTTRDWTNNYEGSGVAGCILTDKTDSSKVLFLPAGGSAYNGAISDINTRGSLWANSLDSHGVQFAKLSTFSNSWFNDDYSVRNIGYSIRPVLDEN